MIIRWYGDNPWLATAQLNELRIKFKTLFVGGIDTGKTVEVEHFDGNKTIEPIIRQGVAIEFEPAVDESILQMVDVLVPSLLREGLPARNLAAEINELKAKVGELEKKVR